MPSRTGVRPDRRGGRRRRLVLGAALAALVLVLAGCPKPLEQPGDTSAVTLIATTTQGGWVYETYRNTAYPCSISGYQTFTVATRVGQAPTVAKPLWVYLHGGGVGYFSPDGTPQPSAGQKVEENPATQIANLSKGLNGQIRGQTVGYRMLAVSMCNHDIDSGARHPRSQQPEHDTRRRAPDGERPVRHQGCHPVRVGPLPHRRPLPLRHERRRVRRLQRRMGLERQGIAATGIVADSGILNVAWQYAVKDSPSAAGAASPRSSSPSGSTPTSWPTATTPTSWWPTVGSARRCSTCSRSAIPASAAPGRSRAAARRHDRHDELGRVPARADAGHHRGAGARQQVAERRTVRRSGRRPRQRHVRTTPRRASRAWSTAIADWPADYNSVVVDWIADRRADD